MPATTTSSSKSATSKRGPQISEEDRYRMIADAAYFRAEHRGFNGGDPGQDWLDAEAEIDGMLRHSGQMPGMTAKQAFQEALQAQLEDLDARVQDLRMQASLAKLELREEYAKQLDVLAKKRDTAQSRLNDLRRRAEGAWEDLREGTEQAWQDLRETLDRLASRFK